MNLQVLEYLIENPDKLEDQAKDVGVDGGASIGIAKLLLAEGGNLDVLKGKQQYHYEHVLRPLLENVPCDGVVGIIEDEDGAVVSSCVQGGFIDDESLYICYLEDDFNCQNCRYDAEKMASS
jgi:hypothetical protein